LFRFVSCAFLPTSFYQENCSEKTFAPNLAKQLQRQGSSSSSFLFLPDNDFQNAASSPIAPKLHVHFAGKQIPQKRRKKNFFVFGGSSTM
jgi:hypothetical protein